MSYEYEYLDPSCYDESDQYQTEEYEIEHQAAMQHYEYRNNSSFREEHEQLAPDCDINMEVAHEEEQDLETESCKLKYHNADTIIQTEIKEIIVKKETDKIRSVILNEQRADFKQQIRGLEELRNKVIEENNFLTMNVEIEKAEFLNLQKRVAFNEEIVDRLEQFIETLKKEFDQLKVRNSQHMLKIREQIKKTSEAQNKHRQNISQLKTSIANSRIPRKDPNNLKDENMRLKAKIVEKQTHLKDLKEHCEEIDEKEKTVKNLIDEKECLQKELEIIKCQLKEREKLAKSKEEDFHKHTTHLNAIKEEKSKRIDQAITKKKNLDTEKERISNDIQQQRTVLLQKEEYNAQLDEKICKLVELYESRKLFREEQIQEQNRDVESAEEKVRTADEDLAELCKENDELSCSLELIKQQYIAKMEEKSDALLSKLICEEQLHSEEVLSTNIKLLEEQIIVKKKCHEELLQKVEALSADQSIEELKKKKAYLISSTEYLTEKKENLTKEAESINKIVKDIEDSINHYKQLTKENREKLDKLKKELEEKTDCKEVEEENETNITPASILKSPLRHKKAPVSPKKVQFEGVSSFESSSNSEAATPCGSQQSIVGKTFDDILQEIQAEAFKKPAKAPKKRKLDIE